MHYTPLPQLVLGQTSTLANQPLQYTPALQAVPRHTNSMPENIQAGLQSIQPTVPTQPTNSTPSMTDARIPLNCIQSTHPYTGRTIAALPSIQAMGSQPHSTGPTHQPQITPPANLGVPPVMSLPSAEWPVNTAQPLGPNRSEQRPRKRLRDSNFKPSNNGTLFDGGIIQLPAVGNSFWGNKTSIQDQLINATRQLSKPRSTPGPSEGHEHMGKNHEGSKGKRPMHLDGRDDDEELEELGEVAQEEGTEITRSVYEDDLEDEKGPAMRRVYRLMSRMLQKQEALRNSLENMKQGTHGSDDTAPPRISPAKPRKEVNWDQSIACTELAGRQPRVARQVLIAKIIRISLMGLCKRKSNKDPIVPPPTDVRIPTRERFYIECQVTETSLFNRLAAKIVVEEVKQYWAEHYKDTPLTK
ncbi:hypothetical protein FRC11_002791, partial [Ceratobasidium sp. 423]